MEYDPSINDMSILFYLLVCIALMPCVKAIVNAKCRSKAAIWPITNLCSPCAKLGISEYIKWPSQPKRIALQFWFSLFSTPFFTSSNQNIAEKMTEVMKTPPPSSFSPHLRPSDPDRSNTRRSSR